ncbi:hypothetical protein [Ornithinimicrobium kibberense]|uniref:hypothetical protein n=1 Tax=Ornithinimicrobium kibberense TaxID=282060 RepID=UPI003607542B
MASPGEVACTQDDRRVSMTSWAETPQQEARATASVSVIGCRCWESCIRSG